MFRFFPRPHVLALVLVTIASFAPNADAAVRTHVEAGRFKALHVPSGAAARIKIERVPLAGREQTLILEPFDVLAPDAVIEVFDGEGKPRQVKPQAMRQYRGSVEGDPESVVYLSAKDGDKLDGFIITGHRKYSMWTTGAQDVFLDELTAAEEREITTGLSCDVEGGVLASHAQNLLPRSLATNADGRHAGLYAWPTTTATTMLNLALETDTALYTNFSGNATNVETFIRNLVGATSTIYKRDLRTEIRIPYLGIHTTSDPFAVNPGQTGTWNGSATTYSSLHAMLELGDRWHNSPPSSARRSGAILISGQSQTAGIAWIGTTCTGDFAYQTHWGGAYAYCGGVGLSAGDRTVPNPDANPNFAATSTGFWPLLQLAHEFGHNVQSDHTHCIQLSAADQITYGRTYVDRCYSGASGCYSGPTSFPTDAPNSRGTIMSYCHLLGGSGAMRFTFGQAGEASHTIVDAMRARLDLITPTGLSSITVPASVSAGISTAASVTNTPGLTYDWSIVNGTFTGGGTTATGASVNFTGTTSPVTLRVTATNTSGCSVSDTATVTVAAAVVAPANVLATATTSTNVNVTWTAAAGAASYNVYRRAAGGAFTLAGNTTGTSLNDTVAANAAYLYTVRTVNGGESANSNIDLATTVIYTDPTLTAGSTPLKAAHVTELRTAVNAVRTLAGTAIPTFTDPTLTSATPARSVHITELRTNLDTARAALALTAASYTDASPAGVPIRKVHIDELRNAMR